MDVKIIQTQIILKKIFAYSWFLHKGDDMLLFDTIDMFNFYLYVLKHVSIRVALFSTMNLSLDHFLKW